MTCRKHLEKDQGMHSYLRIKKSEQMDDRKTDPWYTVNYVTE